VPTVEKTRTIAASPEEVWEVVGDPHHLPRWWPRVQRVEAVEDGAFTEVLMSAKGKIVRADFKLVDTPEPWRIVWSQQVENTPFERVLKSAETDIRLSDGHGSHGPLTEVTIELRQTLQGFRGSSIYRFWFTGFTRFGSPLVLRAATSTVEEALDGLESIAGAGAQ
jgi:uncharacterized protein YndB with AHSA1/START domain